MATTTTTTTTTVPVTEETSSVKFCPIVHLPDELTIKIAGELEDVGDRLKLSSTCWHLRLIVGAEFFKVTKFSNDEKSGEMMTGLARSKANILVKHLHFYGRAPTDRSPDYKKTANILPGSVHTILADVHQFPNFEKLTITFDFKLQKDEWDGKLCELFPRTNIEDALAGESSVGWKSLMARTFEALVPNREKGIKNLEVRDLPPLLVSPYWNPLWRELLAKVEELRLAIWGEDCGHDKKVLAAQGYRLFFKHMDWAWASRLTNLTTLRFSPSIAGMVSGQSMASVLWSDMTFPFDGSHMRKLKSLTFDNTFLTVELLDFVVSHIATLEDISFKQCYAYEEHPEENVHRVGVSWQELFTVISEARGPRLRSFEFTSPELPRHHLVPEEDESVDRKDRDISRELHQLTSSSPGKRYFPYAHLSNNAELVSGWDFVLKHYKEGKDLDAYNGLMGLVAANALEVPTRLQRLAAKYKDSMSFISARKANTKA